MLKEIELLKIGLLAKGMQVSDLARRAIEGDKKRPMTLADYASTSGICLELPEDIWVNAPIADYNPNFVSQTQYTLDFREGRFWVLSPNRDVQARPIPVPAYFDKTNKHGEKFTRFGITHTDRVRISPIEGCVNSCQFCDMPFTFQYRTKAVADLVELIQVALADPVQPARHIMASGGTPRPQDYDYLNSVYDSVVSAFPNIPFDIMMTPMPKLLDARRLRDIGVNGLSINLELWNEEVAQRIMPHKHQVTRGVYLNFIANAVEVFGEGKVRSLLMVGLEPLEDTLKGVEALAQRGCDPVLSPFRPSPATPLKDMTPPTAEYLREVYERARDIVERYPKTKLGPRCIPCHHNTLTFPDKSGKYYFS